MLLPRVLTALVLLAVLLPTLASSAAWPFPLFVALTMGAAGWEWARLNGWTGPRAVAYGAIVLLMGALLQPMLANSPGWAGLVGAGWVLGGTAALRGGVSGWVAWSAGWRLALGPLVLLPAAWALVAWKGLGLNALLSVFCLVWAADVLAYAAGRLWGRRKLAPAISPGKSWEGVAGGVVGVLGVAALWVSVIDPVWASSHGLSLYGRLVDAWGWPIAALVLLVLTALSVVGDLVESLIKRAAGAKDSSQLLPGHGGVLDRIDALLPVLPAALGVLLLAPGGAA